jgi:hypothetical protein
MSASLYTRRYTACLMAALRCLTLLNAALRYSKLPKVADGLLGVAGLFSLGYALALRNVRIV